MPISLSNSKDIVANSLSLIEESKVIDVKELFLSKLDAINNIVGLPPETLDTIQKLANSINNDSNFYSTLVAALNEKSDKSTTYTKSETDNKINDLIAGAPNLLNTLDEIAAALNDDPTFSTTILNLLANKANKDDPIITGTLTAPLIKATNKYVSGTTNDYIEVGYDSSNTRSFINFVQSSSSSNDKLSIRQNDNNVATFTSSGNFGLNTASPGNAKLQIVGGVQNVANEETAIKVLGGLNNVKIELENTATNGKRYEIRSTNTGSFEITDRTGSATRYSISSTGAHQINGNLTISGTTTGITQAMIPNLTNDLSAKANASDVYSKQDTNNLLANKANSSDVYSKQDTNNLLANKANASDVYSKQDANNLLANKANASDVYSKNETNYLLDSKQDNINMVNGIQSYLYPQSPLKFTNGTVQISGLPFDRTLLELDMATIYNKTEVATLLNGKLSITDLESGIKSRITPVSPLNYSVVNTETSPGVFEDKTFLNLDMTNIYTKTQVDALIPTTVDAYTKSETYTKTEVNSALSSKADTSTTYTITQVNNLLNSKLSLVDLESGIKNRITPVSPLGYSVASVETSPGIFEDKSFLNLDMTNIYTKSQVDLKFQNPVFGDNINFYNANVSNLLSVNAIKKQTLGGYITFIDDVKINNMNLTGNIKFGLYSSPNTTISETGYIGIKTLPTNAPLQIAGGVQNEPNEETAIKVSSGMNNVKIELENTATNGKKYEVRSTSSGSFDITDRTGGATRYSIDTNGNHNFTGTINAGGDLIVASNSVAIGTASTTDAKVSIVGGVQNTTNNETALRVSGSMQYVNMQINNTATNGKNYELRSMDTGAFEIADRTINNVRYAVDTNGNHGFWGSSMNFNNVDIFKPLCAGNLDAAGAIQLSVGKIGFSCNKNGDGRYEITFATPLPDANYIVSITWTSGVLTALAATFPTKTSSMFIMQCLKTNGTGQNSGFTFVVYR